MELRLTTKVGDIFHVSWLFKKFLSMSKVNLQRCSHYQRS
jgi:hypothetical protein